MDKSFLEFQLKLVKFELVQVCKNSFFNKQPCLDKTTSFITQLNLAKIVQSRSPGTNEVAWVDTGGSGKSRSNLRPQKRSMR